MRLSELKTGEKGVIVKVLGHGGFRKRIVEMGFIKGKTVEVILNAPLKDPIKYKILGYEISLRRQEAEMIEIVSEEEASGPHPDLPQGEGVNGSAVLTTPLSWEGQGGESGLLSMQPASPGDARKVFQLRPSSREAMYTRRFSPPTICQP